MDLVLNEVAKAEYIIDTGELGTKPGSSIFLIARYYKQIKHMRVKDIVGSIHNIMEQTYPGYIRSNWEDTIEAAAKQAGKRPLVSIGSIPVTEAEISTVDALQNIKHRRLAFTMIVIAKYYNLVHTENNNWINLDPKRVFGMACVQASKADQALMYSQLTKCGIIAYSRKTGNVNARVLCLQPDSPVALEVTDLRCVGNDYMMFHCKRYSVCLRCGVTFKQNKQNNRKYCKECEGWHPIVRRKFRCADCGKEVFVVSRNTKSIRCPSCQTNEKHRQANLYRLCRNDYQTSGAAQHSIY